MGVRLGVLGSYVWIMALAVAFFAMLAYYAQFILPVRGESGWYEGLRLLVAYFFYAPAVRPRPNDSGRRTSPIAPSFFTLGAGIVESHQALALAKGASFTRAAGPGYVVLNRGEWIGALVDLRRHLRRQMVKAMTRDGIPLETVVSVIFRVRQLPPDQAAPTIQYPYDPDAIFRIGFAETIREDENQQPWNDLVCPQAASALITALADHTLDALFPVNDPGPAPVLDRIKQEVQRNLVTFFEPYGLHILAVAIGRFELPEDVIAQRIQNWQAEWRRRIHVHEASANAEVMKKLKHARARAQTDLIGKLTHNIESMRLSGHADLAEIVTLRMIEALDEALSDERVHNVTPENALANLRHFRQWLYEQQQALEDRPPGLNPGQRNTNETV
jgi:regulator of protease activity HflC (stomatin/prohibitin superfamily)